MSIPEAIQRQIDEAEELERQLYGNGETPTDQTKVENTDAVVVQSEVKVPDSQTAEPVEIKAKPGKEEDLEYWRGRAQTLFGMNQKQAGDIQYLRGQLEELTRQIGQMKTEKPVQEVTAPKDNDAELFGEDLVSAIDRRAEQKAQQLVAAQVTQMQAYIAKLEERLGSVGDRVAETAQDGFLNNLGKLVPDFEAVNADAGFLNWLAEADPVYGVPRQVALDNAANALDANRVAAIFQAYKSLTGKQVAAAQKAEARKELERSVAPNTTQTVTSVPQTGRIWSMKEFESAQDPRNIMKMGREAAERLAAEADQALIEGRVR